MNFTRTASRKQNGLGRRAASELEQHKPSGQLRECRSQDDEGYAERHVGVKNSPTTVRKEAKNSPTAVPKESSNSPTVTSKRTESSLITVPGGTRNVSPVVPKEATNSPTVTPKNIKIVLPNEAKNGPAIVLDGGKNSPTVVPDRAKNSPTLVPNGAKNVVPTGATNSPKVVPKVLKNCPTIVPDEAKNSPKGAKNSSTVALEQAEPKGAKTSTIVAPDGANNSQVVVPDGSENCPTVVPKNGKNSPTVIPNEAKNSPTIVQQAIPTENNPTAIVEGAKNSSSAVPKPEPQVKPSIDRTRASEESLPPSPDEMVRVYVASGEITFRLYASPLSERKERLHELLLDGKRVGLPVFLQQIVIFVDDPQKQQQLGKWLSENKCEVSGFECFAKDALPEHQPDEGFPLTIVAPSDCEYRAGYEQLIFYQLSEEVMRIHNRPELIKFPTGAMRVHVAAFYDPSNARESTIVSRMTQVSA